MKILIDITEDAKRDAIKKSVWIKTSKYSSTHFATNLE